MPRVRRADGLAPARSQAADALTAELDKKKETKPRMASRNKAGAEVCRMIDAKDFSTARAVHFVELYCMGHRAIYGVDAAELDGGGKAATAARKGAVGAAARMLQQEFAHRPTEMVRFFDWVWNREREREKWRRENGKEGGRLTWQVMIAGRAILTDYRAAKLRAVPKR